MTIIDEKLVEAVAKAIQGWEGEQPSRCAGECYYDADWREYIPKARAAITAYEAAKPVAEPVAWVQREVLDELRRHKDATATVASGLLKKPFGNPVALYALSAPASKDGPDALRPD